MSFATVYDQRFTDIIIPAVGALKVGSESLSAKRVDISSSGDSILSDINDGVANSQLVLADVSVIGKDSKTGHVYRNANVLYEVGLALACRQPTDVLLIRDDYDHFLFDVSTIPHGTIDFTDTEAAVTKLRDLLQSRLDEQQRQHDARIELLFTSLSLQELYYLIPMAEKSPGHLPLRKKSNSRTDPGFMRLLDTGVLKLFDKTESGDPAYGLTPLGLEVAKRALATFGRLHMDV